MPRSAGWTPEQCARAAAVYRETLARFGARHGAISYADRCVALALKVSRDSVANRRHNFGTSFMSNAVARAWRTAAFAERDKRSAAADRRDLTARTFGDPAPGYSALDQKQRGAST